MPYTVKSGDTLSKIARDVLSDINIWPALADLNAIKSPWTIYPGQVLTLPTDFRPPAPDLPPPAFAPPLPPPKKENILLQKFAGLPTWLWAALGLTVAALFLPTGKRK